MKILFGVKYFFNLYSQHYLAGMPNTLKSLLIKGLIYKEVARDQALRPTGNPPEGGEGAKSCPGEWIIGGYKLTTMKIKINIQQNPIAQKRTMPTVYIVISDMTMCCCC